MQETLHFKKMVSPDWDRLTGYLPVPEDSPRRLRYFREAQSAFDRLQSCVLPCGVLSIWDHVRVQDDVLFIGDQYLRCPSFSCLEADQVIRAYVFFLSIGSADPGGLSSLQQKVFVDAWATLLLDFCRDQLEALINDRSRSLPVSGFLSPCYGPGYYGMSPMEMETLLRLADLSSVPIHVNDLGLLSPAKSCGGLFLLLKDISSLPTPSCVDCLGEHRNCSYCRIYHSAQRKSDQRRG